MYILLPAVNEVVPLVALLSVLTKALLIPDNVIVILLFKSCPFSVIALLI